MWWLVKFLSGLFVFVVLIVLFFNFLDSNERCNDLGGNYNLTSDGFKCERLLKNNE